MPEGRPIRFPHRLAFQPRAVEPGLQNGLTRELQRPAGGRSRPGRARRKATYPDVVLRSSGSCSRSQRSHASDRLEFPGRMGAVWHDNKIDVRMSGWRVKPEGAGKSHMRRPQIRGTRELNLFSGAPKKSLTLGAFAITLARSKGFASRLRSKLDVPLRRTRP
jgi:hypothetical protein